ncbi:nitroreductase/quinone reductase family protein [Amycolatopsis nigrescens]|uniref:nitroreductase/quinone reductase family protein n=1 Tax=Amycolatopsis nigrescens TaxID=381445 RepID=UPI0003764E79|nr:nitroreductase/quinone reductase family protein [Amycolatopsis nigrescens]
MRYGGTLTKRMVGGFNAGANALRSSPRFGRLVGKYLTVVTYTGRRSGRTFSTPVAYKRAGDTVKIGVALPDAKNWWRNFTGDGGPISLELEGTERTGLAVAHRDDKDRVTLTVRLNG